MNHFHAKAEWIDGAWRALVRYSHKADYWPVMNGDRPAGYPSRAEAEIAALRAQEKHMNGTIRGFGEKADAARANAERLFRPGRKPVVVERA
jgi:hypothetical protein